MTKFDVYCVRCDEVHQECDEALCIACRKRAARADRVERQRKLSTYDRIHNGTFQQRVPMYRG